jgi:hypothetical protein
VFVPKINKGRQKCTKNVPPLIRNGLIYLLLIVQYCRGNINTGKYRPYRCVDKSIVPIIRNIHAVMVERKSRTAIF